MSAEGKSDALHKAIRLILEEVEGCNMSKEEPETKELMALVYEFEARIKNLRKPSDQKQEKKKKHPFKKAWAEFDITKETEKKNKPKPNGWQTGPLAGNPDASPKPPWFEGA